LSSIQQAIPRAKLDESQWFLHKFRATFGTNLLRKGFDIKTVQELLGHKDIQSTMSYLTKVIIIGDDHHLARACPRLRSPCVTMERASLIRGVIGFLKLQLGLLVFRQ
jgi:integrase